MNQPSPTSLPVHLLRLKLESINNLNNNFKIYPYVLH